MQTYSRQSPMPCPAEKLGAYHFRSGALDRLLPPWSGVSILEREPLADGSKVVLGIPALGTKIKYVAIHQDCHPPKSFADRNANLTWVRWHHQHRFEPVSSSISSLCDEIHYQLPVGFHWLRNKFEDQLDAMFDYRHHLTAADLALAESHPTQPLRVGISGSSGLIGGRLSSLLSVLGHEVVPLLRAPAKPEQAGFDPWHDDDAAEKLQTLDAVVHLAGKSIGDGRWSSKVKEEIRSSRVDLTSQLAEKLAGLARPPGVFISGSAIGYYGNRGEQLLDETSGTSNADFLTSVAIDWEAAAMPAAHAGIRTVLARTGVVLDPRGGALQKMLLPAKLGLSGPLGSGRQWFSWIALDDCVGAIYHALTQPDVSGPVNLVAPEPVRNSDFAKTLGRVLRRPACLPAPKLALRMALGEAADALLLSSTRVYPAALKKSEYAFRFETLEPALRFMLGKSSSAPE